MLILEKERHGTLVMTDEIIKDMTEGKLTEEGKARKALAEEFCESVLKKFIEVYGKDAENRPEVRFILHITDSTEGNNRLSALIGCGCPMCAIINLNTDALMKGVRHDKGEEDDEKSESDSPLPNLGGSEIPKNLMN